MDLYTWDMIFYNNTVPVLSDLHRFPLHELFHLGQLAIMRCLHLYERQLHHAGSNQTFLP